MTDTKFKSLYDKCDEVTKKCHELGLFKILGRSFFHVEMSASHFNLLDYKDTITRNNINDPQHDIILMRLANDCSFKDALYRASTSSNLTPYNGVFRSWRSHYRSWRRDDILENLQTQG